MEPEEIRKQVIAALAADDELGELLVLKGGNALRLIHALGDRASLDVDYSIAGELPASAGERMNQALSRQFSALGLAVFDFALGRKPMIDPATDARPTWGGWGVTFKLIDTARYHQLRSDPAKLRNQSLALHRERKAFQVDISKYEYVEPASAVQFQGYQLRVYTPAMILYEKLRALCQQMPEYECRTNASPRPRDFVDICAILDHFEDECVARRDLLGPIFAAKEVPLSLLDNLRTAGPFHKQAWVSVQVQLTVSTASFEHYFERTVAFVDALQSLGIVKPPSV
jgi:predicted nucleotidyltransferase component of viral defense system